MSTTDDLRLSVAWFESAFADGPAYGDPETTTWGNFVSIFSSSRREGDKDGCCVVPSRLRPEFSDQRIVRRKLDRVVARSAIALDVETCTRTGEIPPPPSEAAERVQALEIAGLVYTSHSHTPAAPRYRLILPLSAEIPPENPAPLVLAEHLELIGVLDTGKAGPASLFYLPSCPHGALDLHQAIVVPGDPVDAAWIEGEAAKRRAEEDRVAGAEQQAAAERRAERIAQGFNPDDSLIEKIRSRFDLANVLTSHGYDRSKTNTFRHSASQSGCYGASIKSFGGVDRVYSHNAGDLLHHSNLPSWCGVKAVDAFDAVVVLDFGGDRDRALRELSEKFKLSKAPARKAVAAVIHRKIRQRASQEAIEAAAFTAGYLHGLTRPEVVAVARFVASKFAPLREACGNATRQ